MNRFIETGCDEFGRYTLETLADAEGCRWSVNEVCCNEQCDMFGDLPYPKECNREGCECFETELQTDIELFTVGVKHYDCEEDKSNDLH